MKAYAFLANGSEEVECLLVVDLLKRAGLNVTLVSIHDNLDIISAHGIKITCDILIDDVKDDADLLFIPGGLPGTDYMRENDKLKKLLIEQNNRDRRIAAICAAPSVLGFLGLLKGKKATVFPGFEEYLDISLDEQVVTDGNITTAKGLGAAFELSFELIKLLISEKKAEEIKKQIQYKD